MTDCSSRHPSSELMEAPDQVSEENQKEKVLLPEDSKPALRRGKWTPEGKAVLSVSKFHYQVDVLISIFW